MADNDRRRLHDEQRLEALARDPRVSPVIRAALQVGAKVGEGRRRRNAFLTGLVLGLVLGAVLAILLVRFGASEGQQ